MEIGERLKELRTQKGLSQAELAKRLNLSKSTISMIEVGSRNPSFEVLELIADYFNVDMAYLLGEENQSRFFMDYATYDVAMELSNDAELLAVVEKASKDNNFRERLLGIVKILENDK
ncbi:MAG: helix-turn-helix transcriptional regulator [Acutalibacteraceae bacterium]|nr:helix-turn-helix transcriptional regulator [Acutalibacteraceae bacterium]